MPGDKNLDRDLLASMVIMRSEIRALLMLCDQLARKAGIDNLEGVSPVDWYLRARLDDLREALRELEDVDPALAAFIQQTLDHAAPS